MSPTCIFSPTAEPPSDSMRSRDLSMSSTPIVMHGMLERRRLALGHPAVDGARIDGAALLARLRGPEDGVLEVRHGLDRPAERLSVEVLRPPDVVGRDLEMDDAVAHGPSCRRWRPRGYSTREKLPGIDLTDRVRSGCREIAERARSVSIDPERLAALETEAVAIEPAQLDPERHYLEGTPEDVAAYLLVLDSINFGSGWFPTLRKRLGCSGYYTVAWGLADRWRADGPWSRRRARGARRRRRWPPCWARTRRTS